MFRSCNLSLTLYILRDFGPILLPLQSAMRVTLPSTPGSHVDHNPFPTDPIFLQGFEDGVSTGSCSSLNQQVLINRCVVSPDTHLNCFSLQNRLCHSTNRCLLTGVIFHPIHTWIVSLFRTFSVAQPICYLQMCHVSWYVPDLHFTSKCSLLLSQQVLVNRCVVLPDTHLNCVSSDWGPALLTAP